MNAVTKETIATSPSADSKARAFLRSVFGERFVPHYRNETLRDWTLPTPAYGQSFVFKNVILANCTLSSLNAMTFINCTLKNCRIACDTLNLEKTLCTGGHIAQNLLHAQSSRLRGVHISFNGGGTATSVTTQDSFVTDCLFSGLWYECDVEAYSRIPGIQNAFCIGTFCDGVPPSAVEGDTQTAKRFLRRAVKGHLFSKSLPEGLSALGTIQEWLALAPKLTNHGPMGEGDTALDDECPYHAEACLSEFFDLLSLKRLSADQWSWGRVDQGTPFIFPGDSATAPVKLWGLSMPAIVAGLALGLLFRVRHSSLAYSEELQQALEHLLGVYFQLGGSYRATEALTRVLELQSCEMSDWRCAQDGDGSYDYI